MARPFVYTKAVVCGIADSLPAAALRLCEPKDPVDLQKARLQHQNYVDALKSLGLEVVELPADNRYPDCVFVEDPVVVCGNTALITIPGHEDRMGEAEAIGKAMMKLGLRVVEMTSPARMDGGDVLFTGREFFVGVSQRTNEAGLTQLAGLFKDCPVTEVPVEEGLHLKSFCSMAGDNLIAIGSSPAAQRAKQLISSKAKFPYQFLTLPDDIGANCVFVNGTLIRPSHEVFPRSAAIYEQLDCPQIPLSSSELNKVDGCFTCCSVLIP